MLTQLQNLFDGADIQVSDAAKSFLCQLVCPSEERLDLTAIRAHEFFCGVDWSNLEAGNDDVLMPWFSVGPVLVGSSLLLRCS